jgi:hypothetical protein
VYNPTENLALAEEDVAFSSRVSDRFDDFVIDLIVLLVT